MKKLLVFLFLTTQVFAQKDAKEPYLSTLQKLGNALLSTQNKDVKDKEFGGLKDPESDLYYTRAAEAVFPFYVLYKNTGDKKWLQASIQLGNWLLTKQEKTGEWIENPWTWTGTTADQLLMMSATYPLIESHLTPAEKVKWKTGISNAADYLVRVMSPDFASINYIPTSAASLALTWQNIEKRDSWLKKAQLLASQTIAKMDDDYFIEGEAARFFKAKYGVDIGYQADMSLWGLALYAKITNDKDTWGIARKSLENIVHFVYPNGAIDGSWGARCYKWTGYGSKTADGATFLFSLFANEDAKYQTAALRNLEYLNTAIKDGFVGYGKHIWGIPGKKANLYPTFARAKTIAMALEWGHIAAETPPMPADLTNWTKTFHTVNVGVVRIGGWMATISGYQYQDVANWGKGKYHHFPRGGTLCNLYLDNWGWLTTSSQTVYQRGEYIHMPEVKDSIQCLTPRVEFKDKDGYFTNIYDSKAEFKIEKTSNTAEVVVKGELCDSLGYPGGIAFTYNYLFKDKSLAKSLKIRYHDKAEAVNIIEPIVLEEGVKVEKISETEARISTKNKSILFKITEGEGKLIVGENAQNFWYPFPGLRCYPIKIQVKPKEGLISQVITYEFEVEK